MTATLASTPTPTVPRPSQGPSWTCPYCKNGLHRSCPGMLLVPARGRIERWVCDCGRSHRPPYCHSCKNEAPGEVDPTTWRCLDRCVCDGRVEVRRANNELYQQLMRVKANAAAERKRKRLMVVRALEKVDPVADAQIDNQTETSVKLRGRTKPSRVRPVWASSGICQCGCGGRTKGGRFLVGHDAKLAGKLIQRVRRGDVAAYAEMRDRGWLKKLSLSLRAKWEAQEDTK